MQNTTTGKRKFITVPVTEPVRAGVEVIAQECDWSLSKTAGKLIAEALAARAAEQEKAAA